LSIESIRARVVPSRRRFPVGRPRLFVRATPGTGRYPPQPKFEPFAFYSCFRLGDPEQAAIIMETDPYYWTQDNGAGGPVHFATTYKQIDMLHHILRNCPQAVNQRDVRGFTPLHRAAYLAQYDGYQELYEYLLSEGADPRIVTEDYDPYLNPGRKTPIEVAVKDGPTRDALRFLEEKYADTKKKSKPHGDIGDWWALYDYGPEKVYGWTHDFEPDYPERRRNAKDAAEKREWKKKRKAARDAAIAAEIAKREGTQIPATSADALPIAALKVSEVADATATPATPAGRGAFRRVAGCVFVPRAGFAEGGHARLRRRAAPFRAFDVRQGERDSRVRPAGRLRERPEGETRRHRVRATGSVRRRPRRGREITSRVA
jgi:[acyl-carrier-protein] S-malonyltransferase